jgi:26S proteasome non-ATPase regulatory subunit 9
MTDSAALFSLDKQRKSLEEEASAITSELTASIDGKEPMGISTPLVDKDGYPRADIDVYRARYLRKRLHEIRFDHDVIMKQMEEQILKNVRLLTNQFQK